MEIHVELKTNSKMFCGCKNDPFHAPKPNIYTCPVCLGLPGALPVPNKKAVEWTIMLGLALGSEISLFSKFDRKNYFYPDLPKGYQISQYDQPIARGGKIVIASEAKQSFSPRHPELVSGSKIASSSRFNLIGTSRNDGKTIRIHRVHLEEDTGKLIHSTVNGKKVSLIDFNRSGVPLVEIVTEPDINSSEEAKAFLKKLHQIIRYLDISDADMEKGSMRLEPNISVKIMSLRINAKQSFSPRHPELVSGSKIASSSSTPRNDDESELPSYKVEVKNINSFNFVKKAIDYEVGRQIEILEAGETPVQETRGWEEKKGVTLPQRRKEAAHDYRYFPEPDIPPMRVTKDQISELRTKIPELPDVKLARFIKNYQLKPEDAARLTDEVELANFFEKCASQLSIINSKLSIQSLANWIINKKVDYTKASPEELIKVITATKQVKQVDEVELTRVIDQIIAANPQPVAEYKKGKTGIIMFFVGQVKRELKGRGDAVSIRKILQEQLK